ncbi:hypothetical protein [Pseudotamlana agarivorans]|uniref:hypothetical protein n=1 Tax=Pseudotamlana agarivorans TaxID=481183 RepID=UPI0008357D92|nr:hypothetical protein [Tamlana agarivorans]
MYISGHYKKVEDTGLSLAKPRTETEDLRTLLKDMDSKLEALSKNTHSQNQNILNSALGSAASDATIKAAQKLFAPQTLPATKGDMQTINQQLKQLSLILRQLKT